MGLVFVLIVAIGLWLFVRWRDTGIVGESRKDDAGDRVLRYDTDSKMIGRGDRISSRDTSSDEYFTSSDYKRNYWDLSGGEIVLPNLSSLYQIVRSEYEDDQYKFNVANQPVTTRSPNRNTVRQDNVYLRYVRENVESWNEIFLK